MSPDLDIKALLARCCCPLSRVGRGCYRAVIHCYCGCVLCYKRLPGKPYYMSSKEEGTRLCSTKITSLRDELKTCLHPFDRETIHPSYVCFVPTGVADGYLSSHRGQRHVDPSEGTHTIYSHSYHSMHSYHKQACFWTVGESTLRQPTLRKVLSLTGILTGTHLPVR